jgi:hypothetical protein
VSATTTAHVPRLLAAGEPRARVSTHVGYGVIRQMWESSFWSPNQPALTGAFCVAALAILAWGAAQRARRGPILAGAVTVTTTLLLVPLLPLTALAVLSLVSAPLDEHPDICGRLVTTLVLVSGTTVVHRLWRAAQARCAGDRTGDAWIGALAALLPVVGLLTGLPGHAVIRPSVLQRLQSVERVAAATEAQAVRLGRWPTQEEWRAVHGAPRDRYGARLHYSRHAPRGFFLSSRPEDQQPFAIRCQPRADEPLHATWYDSRLFGPDGLFGTPDDQMSWLEPKRFRRTALPHGRAPRDPGVVLPDWPAAEVR